MCKYNKNIISVSKTTRNTNRVKITTLKKLENVLFIEQIFLAICHVLAKVRKLHAYLKTKHCNPCCSVWETKNKNTTINETYIQNPVCSTYDCLLIFFTHPLMRCFNLF